MRDLSGCPDGSASACVGVRAAQRTASVAPLAASMDRHERGHTTKFQDRAQVWGRASGVNCTQCWAAREI